MWYTSGDDGQLPQGVKVGRARLDKGEWRIDLSMMEGHIDFVRLVPPPAIPRPDAPELPPPPQPAGAKPTGSPAKPKPAITSAAQTPAVNPGASPSPRGPQ
jgi:hypothetical protein